MWKRTSSARLEIDYPDTYFTVLRHENGTKGVLAVDVVSPKAVRNFEVFGEGLHLFWEGSPQSLAEYDSAPKMQGAGETPTPAWSTMRAILIILWRMPMPTSWQSFLPCWRAGAAARYSFEKDKETIALIERIEQA